VTQGTLTDKQQTVFEFIQRYFTEHRRSPLIREIQLGCRITSYKSAIDRLNALERKRFIRRAPNKHRGIRVLRRPAESPVAVAAGGPSAWPQPSGGGEPPASAPESSIEPQPPA
jgi:SOS-response transcriptional repressor LexA